MSLGAPLHRRGQACGLVVLAVLAVLVASCGGGADSSGDDVTLPAPPERLADALTALSEANTGRFTSETADLRGVRVSAMTARIDSPHRRPRSR